MKNISTAFSLSPHKDRILRIEAAKQGLSKTKFAQTIIEEWVDNATGALIRQRFENIASAISIFDGDKDCLYDTLERIITACCDCMELGVKMNYAPSQELKEKYAAVMDSLASDIKIINDFCDVRGLPGFIEPAEEFAEELIKEYFQS